MFNKTKVINAYSGLVGYDNPFNPDYDIVNSANQVSDSGRKVTDNPHCKIEYLKDNFDYADNDTDEFNAELTKISNQAIVNILDKVFYKHDYIAFQLIFGNDLCL